LFALLAWENQSWAYKTIVDALATEDRRQHGATRDVEAEKSGTQPNAWFLIGLLI
jgi:hypothetical protein